METEHTDKKAMISLRDALQEELDCNILGFWADHAVDEHHGGFIGRMSNTNKIEVEAPKGLILNTRILWTFSAAYRVFGKTHYLDFAQRALAYLKDYFLDREHVFFWLLDHQGRLMDDKKRVYGQAFAIYALAEYHRATGDTEALQLAKNLFAIVEASARDNVYLGYLETYNRDWSIADDLRLSEKDMDVAKSMNTHLHLLEAYTNLYRIWKDDLLRQRLTELISVFQTHIIDEKNHHFILFFDELWQPQSDGISFGHDIEGSWLLTEAAEVLGIESDSTCVNEAAVAMTRATLEEGLESDGGLLYEAGPEGIRHTDRHWWPQAEAVVGFLNSYQLTKEQLFLDVSLKCWNYIQQHLIDSEFGEWYWKVSREGIPDMEEPKISEWKGPYHNSRMCFEVLARLDIITASDLE